MIWRWNFAFIRHIVWNLVCNFKHLPIFMHLINICFKLFSIFWKYRWKCLPVILIFLNDFKKTRFISFHNLYLWIIHFLFTVLTIVKLLKCWGLHLLLNYFNLRCLLLSFISDLPNCITHLSSKVFILLINFNCLINYFSGHSFILWYILFLHFIIYFVLLR